MTSETRSSASRFTWLAVGAACMLVLALVVVAYVSLTGRLKTLEEDMRHSQARVSELEGQLALQANQAALQATKVAHRLDTLDANVKRLSKPKPRRTILPRPFRRSESE